MSANHIGGLRKDAARQKIKSKIEVLERYASDIKSIPEGACVPKNLAGFRLWEDEDLGLEKIGSPNTMDAPHNAGLKKRALELIEKLAKKKDRKERRDKIVATQRAEIESLGRLVRELTNQFHATREALVRSQQSEKRLENRNEELARENGELRRQLRTVTGLRPVNGIGGEHHGVQ
jgi:chromosome condensin MukBEF ATPase and DNA-binding subunit MukB